MDSPLLWLGTVACASSAALGLLPLSHRTRLTGLTVGLLGAPILIAADNWGGDRLADLRDRPSLLLAILVAAAIGLVILAIVFRRWPVLLAPALVAVMPFRIPIDLGGGSSNILIPLYAVIAAGLLAAIVTAWRGPPPAGPSAGEAGGGRGWLDYIGYALAGVVVLYALQAGYVDDLTPALQNVCFFLAPFAALYYLIEGARWDAAALRVIVVVLAVEGLLFVLVGGFQYLTGELFWNDKVISGNEAHTYFRVNSLFWDPNILGRYLVVTMVTMAAVIAYGRNRREALTAAAVFVALLALLVFSFSQTSTISLFAGLMVLIAARWGMGYGVAAALATMLALAASIALVAGGGLSGETTSGRAGLIDGGVEIAVDHPLLGTGSGGFAPEFTERFYEGEGFAAESHTEPVTVAAEQGVVGLVAYLGLLLVTFGALLSATGFELRDRARGAPVAAALLAIYSVMFVHTLGYAAFLVDPITWVVLALAASTLVRAPNPASRRQSA